MGKIEHYSAKRRPTQGVQRKKAISTAFENEQLTQGVAQAVSQPDARSLTPDVVRSLQRSHGNQFVQRLVNTANRSGIQRTPEPIRTSTTPRLQRLAYTDAPSSWGGVTVTRSGEGIKGVFFVKKGGSTVVVKPSDSPGNMDYANQVMEGVGLEAPKQVAYTKDSTEGQSIAQLLIANKAVGRTATEVEDQVAANTHFVVMNTVAGDSIQRLDDDTEVEMIQNDAALKNIGRLMVADVFIGNSDRLVGSVNLGNFFYQAGNGIDMGNIATIDNEAKFNAGSADDRAKTISYLFSKTDRAGYLQGFLAKLKANAARKPKTLALLDTMPKMQAIMDKISVGVDDGFTDLAAKFAGTMDIVRRDLRATNARNGETMDVNVAKALGLFIVALVNGTDAKTARANLAQYLVYRNRRGKFANGFKWLAKLGGRGF